MSSPTLDSEQRRSTPAPGGQLSGRQELLDRIALWGVDVEAALARVDRRVSGRRRSTRISGVSLLLLLVVVGGILFVAGDEDPDDVRADRAPRETSTTSTASTTTVPIVIEALPEPAPTPTLVPTTLPAPTTVPTPSTLSTLPPATTPPPPPPTTVPPNQALTASLEVVSQVVRVGDVADVVVEWSDPDHSGVAPTFAAQWGDPAIAAPAPKSGPQACERPGNGGQGSEQLQFRYATPGRYEIRVEVSTCDGQGSYAEQTTVTGRIEVSPPILNGSLARSVVASVPVGGPAPQTLDEATATFIPDTSPDQPLQLAARIPALDQVSEGAVGGPATVLVLPTGAVGRIELTWQGSRCSAAGTVDLSTAPPGSTPTVNLTTTC